MNRHAPWALVVLNVLGCSPDLDQAAGAAGDTVAGEARNLPTTVNPKEECGIEVSIDRELLITDLSVVEDPDRTVWNGDPDDPISGVWTFGRLMTAMAGTGDPGDFVETWLETWTSDVTLNGQIVAARPGMDAMLANWPRTEDGALDLTASPFRLLAIVNRVDLANDRSAGEGRFVFGVTDDGIAIDFTVIFEYTLPLEVNSAEDWALAWHELSTFELGTAEFNAALQALTDRFAEANVLPLRPNGSAISQIRTNEIDLGKGPWELREYRLDAAGALRLSLPALTPAGRLNRTTTFRDYLNENSTAILDGTHAVPERYAGAPFRAATVGNTTGIWNAPRPIDAEVRHVFSLNTCDGCHGQETSTGFVHISTREAGAESSLSGFLTGIDVVDPRDASTTRTFADLDRRADNMTALLCPD